MDDERMVRDDRLGLNRRDGGRKCYFLRESLAAASRSSHFLP